MELRVYVKNCLDQWELESRCDGICIQFYLRQRGAGSAVNDPMKAITIDVLLEPRQSQNSIGETASFAVVTFEVSKHDCCHQSAKWRTSS